MGQLSDVAPTLLTLMGLVPPTAMTGRSLLVDDPPAVVTNAAE
jgi:bisphosphoglycerate-independent phosphoglycerate mutase (AlkP superfamily)